MSKTLAEQIGHDLDELAHELKAWETPPLCEIAEKIMKLIERLNDRIARLELKPLGPPPGIEPCPHPDAFKQYDYQTRVRQEKADLDVKRGALRRFIGLDIYLQLPEQERSCLNRQLEAMTLYSNILEERIAHFNA